MATPGASTAAQALKVSKKESFEQVLGSPPRQGPTWNVRSLQTAKLLSVSLFNSIGKLGQPLLQAVLRAGAGWDFELGKGFTIAPKLNYDIVYDEKNAVVFGITLGVEF